MRCIIVVLLSEGAGLFEIFFVINKDDDVRACKRCSVVQPVGNCVDARCSVVRVVVTYDVLLFCSLFWVRVEGWVECH